MVFIHMYRSNLYRQDLKVLMAPLQDLRITACLNGTLHIITNLHFTQELEKLCIVTNRSYTQGVLAELQA